MRLVIAFLVLVVTATAVAAVPSRRGVLWRVVQSCLVDHRLTGAAFPCLDVETAQGNERGYAVLRAPLDRSHVIVTPTVRTIGIEATRLRGADAPNYFADAWASRHFAIGSLPKPPPRDALALAVNSRVGRSQDQLHIHVACIQPDIRTTLAQARTTIGPEEWTRLRVRQGAPSYWVRFLPDAALSTTNLIDFAAAGLHLPQSAIDDMTIVVVGASDGFLVMARRRIPHSFDEAHGEALLDPDCAGFDK